MPTIKYDPMSWSHVPTRQLADPHFHVPERVDVLFGADVLAEVIKEGLRKGPANTPVAQESSLGWLVSGRTTSSNTTTTVVVNHAQLDLVHSVHRFWQLEEFPTVVPMTKNQSQCEDHFATTHSRSPSGRFIVRLPMKDTEFLMEPRETRCAAIRRLQQLERQLQKTPPFHREYQDFLKEYEGLNHMRLMTDEREKGESIYLPHHSVIKESSLTTRVRVVFDASAKGRNGTSLNDHLHSGPIIQDDLFSILLRFRTHTVAMTADIHKMFRQILVHEEDQRFQNIVWRENLEHQVQDYRLLTLTYGTTCAPYLATRCLKQLAQDEQKEFPEAAAIIASDFYVDDLITGAETVEAALRLQQQIITVLGRGGFELRKWAANTHTLLQAVSNQYGDAGPSLCLDPDGTINTLGLKWIPNTDHFSITLASVKQNDVDTKRTLLATIASIFDPMGWLAPITVKAKLFLQALWRRSCTWDEELPKDIDREWRQYLNEMNKISQLCIPRRLTTSGVHEYRLHGFCDASERAYAAAIYLQVLRSDNTIQVKLIAAKTRVAPLKFVSLPRLELCGALLLAHLYDTVRTALQIPIVATHAWTDSMITLAWINADASRWKTFVANRVAQIQEVLPATHWNHVNGRDNPVDCASRGLSPGELAGHNLWWTGPRWLTQPVISLTNPVFEITDERITSEERPIHSLIVTVPVPEPLVTQFSSLSKLVRVTAYLCRFINNCQIPREQRQVGFLTRDELTSSEYHWIKVAQQAEFAPELRCLREKLPLPASSRLKTLSPFIDAVGIIRVGGRLRNSTVNIAVKHPILLPKKHEFTTLVVRQEHVRHLHAAPQLLLSSIQQRFWIVCGRDVVRQFVRKCITCHRHNPTTIQPKMGDLPSSRANPSRAFLHTGVDYAGPFTLRVLKGRGQKTFKAYVALFVCFSTHAIHLEVVSDLTTLAFIAALKRFTARRGLCSDLYSDQGTTFVGANKELKTFLKFTRTSSHKEKVNQHLNSQGIMWHFNPPAAPHFGGLWEAGVKSMKLHLHRVVGLVPLNYEEFTTVLTLIEACLNSRPLCPMSSDPNDLAVLTPGHFIIGEPLTSIPEPDYSHLTTSRLSRWQLVQRLVQHFWARWSKEYLARLQQRPKTWTNKTEINLYDLVLIKDEQLPTNRWKLGRVQQLHPGKDGVVRVVTVSTASGSYRRPVVRLSKLPLD